MDHHNGTNDDEDDDELVFTHISHDHPLKLAIATAKPNTTCSGDVKKMEINHNATSDQGFTSPSLQFSDAYFSIELSKSYPHEVKETVGCAVSEDRINVVRGFDRGHSDSNEQGFDTLNTGSDSKVIGDKVMVGGGAQVWEELSQKREGSEFNGRSTSIKIQTSKSELAASNKRSSWWKLLSFC